MTSNIDRIRIVSNGCLIQGNPDFHTLSKRLAAEQIEHDWERWGGEQTQWNNVGGYRVPKEIGVQGSGEGPSDEKALGNP